MAPRKHIIIATMLGVIFALCVSYALGTPHTKRFDRCFDKKAWNTGTLPASYRPCVRIENLFEDGSVEIGVYDYSGTQRYTYSVGAQDR